MVVVGVIPQWWKFEVQNFTLVKIVASYSFDTVYCKLHLNCTEFYFYQCKIKIWVQFRSSLE